MTAPQTPPPCPDGLTWCTEHDGDTHQTREWADERISEFGVRIARTPLLDIGPRIQLVLTINHGGVCHLRSRAARDLADLLDGRGGDERQKAVAAALRQAADELDRITSGGAK